MIEKKNANHAHLLLAMIKAQQEIISFLHKEEEIAMENLVHSIECQIEESLNS